MFNRLCSYAISTENQISYTQFLPWIDNSGIPYSLPDTGNYQIDPVAQSHTALTTQAVSSSIEAGPSSLSATVPWISEPAYPHDQFTPLPSDYTGLGSTQPFTSTLSQTPVFSGLPFYANNPSGRAETVPAHYDVVNSSGAGHTADLTEFDIASVLASGSCCFGGLRYTCYALTSNHHLQTLSTSTPCVTTLAKIRGSPPYSNSGPAPHLVLMPLLWYVAPYPPYMAMTTIYIKSLILVMADA